MTRRRRITVFGGTGFLGRRVVDRLLDHDFAVRVASRRAGRSRTIFRERDSLLETANADVNDEGSVTAAVAGAFGVVNAVSLYVEDGGRTFHSVHVQAAERVAAQSQAAGVERLVHVSGIGADAQSRSAYIRSRGQGEAAVRRAFPESTIVRPAVMFAPDDAFLTTIASLLRRLPAFAMFGRGRTRLQPCHVEDAAEAVARSLEAAPPRLTYELGGPRIYTYETLLRTIAGQLGLRPVLLPMPFAMWHALAIAAEMLPNPPLARNQIELMRIDTVVAPGSHGFEALGIEPRPIEHTLAAMRERH